MADERAPICNCCQGAGTHAYRAYARGASPEDDDEGCTACHETGRTWHDRVFHNSCTGYGDLMRRVKR